MVKEKPVLGIIGGGQLGSMLVQEAKKLNIKTLLVVAIILLTMNAPIIASINYFGSNGYNFANKVDVVTFEFENIPFKILEHIEQFKPVLPKPIINQIVQNRYQKKILLEI